MGVPRGKGIQRRILQRCPYPQLSKMKDDPSAESDEAPPRGVPATSNLAGQRVSCRLGKPLLRHGGGDPEVPNDAPAPIGDSHPLRCPGRVGSPISTDKKREAIQNAKGWLLTLVVYVSGVALAAAVGCSSDSSTAQDITRVDFQDVIASDAEKQDDLEDSRPPLHVAVAAMISPEPTLKYYKELLATIANKVGRRIVFAQKRTYAEVNDMVERKELDLAFVCSGPYVRAHEEFGMELLVVPVAHGQTVYHSYIVVNRDSPIASLDGLEGKTFAFTDPDSNTGYLVPRYMLAKRDQSPETFFGSTFFTHSHDSSIRAVAEGLADGAAVDSLVWEFTNAVDPTSTSRTRIITRSPPYGIPPVVVHPSIDPRLKDRLRESFLTLHNDENTRALLRNLQIDRFALGDDTTYDSVREMQKWLDEKAEVEG